MKNALLPAALLPAVLGALLLAACDARTETAAGTPSGPVAVQTPTKQAPASPAADLVTVRLAVSGMG